MVETGIRSDTAVQITSGLADGDLVIVSGIQQLQPGLEVETDGSPAGSDSTP
jgi:membrane fusion protein (multidrug efflux system)